MKHYNIPVFISHFGCPNDCVFCNQKKINGRETDVSLDDLKDIIESYLKTLPKKSKKEVAFFGGTFTGISLALQKEYLEVVQDYIKNGDVEGIRISTRPDYITKEIVDMLKAYGVTTVELGVQSIDPKVLKATARYYPVERVEYASKLIKEAGIELGIQVMIGLPESIFESDFETAKKVVSLKPEIARIYPTLVIKETEMADMYRKGTYKALELEEAVERCRKIYSLFEIEGINVIRVGLQPSDDLREDGNVIAGPFHPAFREVIEGEIYYSFLKRILELEGKLDVRVNEKNISKIVGINKINRVRLGRTFDIKIDNSFGLNEIQVNEKTYFRKEILEGELNESDNNKHR